MKEDGKIKFFNMKKGFGFIVIEGQDDLFFHHSEVQNKEILNEGDLVSFAVSDGKKGKVATKIFKK